MPEALTLGSCAPILKCKTYSSFIINFRSEITSSYWKRFNCCLYWTKRSFNMRRHRQRLHGLEQGQCNKRLLVNWDFVFRMHAVGIRVVRRYQLGSPLYFVHRGDDQQLATLMVRHQRSDHRITVHWMQRHCLRVQAGERPPLRDLLREAHYWCKPFLHLNAFYERQMHKNQMIE